MKTSIEFYIPIEKLTNFLNGEKVLFSPEPANGLIKIVTAPYNIVYVTHDYNLYYIRKARPRERWNLKHKRKLK